MASSSPAMQASNAAKKRVLDAHPEEYQRYVREEREARGLDGNPEEAKLRKQLKKLEDRAEKLRNQLNSG